LTKHIITRKRGSIGHITLDRPEALNALTEDMCVAMTRALQDYAADPSIGAVVIDGAGERAFCAGGDVVLLHDSGKAGDDRAEKFWRTEYALNEYIFRYPKPYITLILACDLGVANAYIPTDQHDALIEALSEAKLDGSDAAVVNVMKDFVVCPPKSEGLPEAISCFNEATVPAILRALDEDGSDWAMKQAKSLRRKSPLALSVTLEALRRGAKLSFRDAMERELDISLGFLITQDFYEGIRAQLIDKDRNPKWSHDMGGVTQAQVSRVLGRHATTPLEFLS